jgi:ribonuclease P protein component
MVLRLLNAQVDLLPPRQRSAPLSPWRCGVVISSKVHKRSVRRNRLRRMLHDHLLLQLGADQAARTLKSPLWLLISLKPGSAEREASDLLGECSQLLRQAGLTP